MTCPMWLLEWRSTWHGNEKRHATSNSEKSTGVALVWLSMASKHRYASNTKVCKHEFIDTVYSGDLTDFMKYHENTVLVDFFHALSLNRNTQELKKAMIERILNRYEAIKPRFCKAMSAVEPICGPTNKTKSWKTNGLQDGNNLVGDFHTVSA